MTGVTLFVNGNVLTVDRQFSRAEALAVQGDRILAVGTTADIRRFKGPGAREVDLAGRTLIPGFVDTHGHVALFGLDEHKVSLTGAGTRAEILGRLQQRIAATPKGSWVVAMPIGDPIKERIVE